MDARHVALSCGGSEDNRMKPKLGTTYSRRAISKMLGGSQIAYLPQKDGQILCGCFDTSSRLNPGAPSEVLVGGGAPEVNRTAEMVARQPSAIPVFLRRAPSRWEYVGDYVCTRLSRDPSLLQRTLQQYPHRRNGIAGVLYFKRV